MKALTINIQVKQCLYNELDEEERQLIDAARQATRHSYAPYSHFAVGAAALLANGTIITGTNQENASSPAGICAERTAVFHANSRYPHQAIKTIAIAAATEKDFTEYPTPPCGICRQVMLETEKRYAHPIRLLLYGKQYIYVVNSIADLLPLSFDASSMDDRDMADKRQFT